MVKLFSKIVLLTFSFLVIVSCSSSKVTDTKALQRQWMMVEVDGFTKEQLISKKAELNLTQPETSDSTSVHASAFMGCNRINGLIEVKPNNQLQMNNMIMTEMACNDMNLEDVFVKKLNLVTHYKIDGHFLSLYQNDILLMKFVAADWD